MGQIRIVSDGTSNGTRVLDSKGDPIDNVYKIELRTIMVTKDSPTPYVVVATLTFAPIELDIDASVDS